MLESTPSSRSPKRSDAISVLVVLAHIALVFAPVFLTAAWGWVGGWCFAGCGLAYHEWAAKHDARG